jgi:DNA-binding NarL/FixJ family response regulator
VSTPPKPIRVLIADDHAPTRADVYRALDADERFEICADMADAAGAEGYLLKTMDFAWLPDVLTGVCSGEAAIPPALVSRVLRRFRTRDPRWRQPLDHGSAERLTSREWEVLELLAQGHSTAEIAGGLVITTSAVRAHITAIVRKLNVTGRAAAIELFRERSDT